MNIPYYGISSGKLRRYFDLKNFTDPFRVLKGFGQSPFHLVYLGAEPGTLGAADAEFRVYECFHVGTTSIQNKKRR